MLTCPRGVHAGVASPFGGQYESRLDEEAPLPSQAALRAGLCRPLCCCRRTVAAMTIGAFISYAASWLKHHAA